MVFRALEWFAPPRREGESPDREAETAFLASPLSFAAAAARKKGARGRADPDRLFASTAVRGRPVQEPCARAATAVCA